MAAASPHARWSGKGLTVALAVVPSRHRSPRDGAREGVAMRLSKSGVVGVAAAACVAAAIGSAPAAVADESCDPEVVACDAPGGFDSPGNVQINDAPPPSADEGYPF